MPGWWKATVSFAWTGNSIMASDPINPKSAEVVNIFDRTIVVNDKGVNEAAIVVAEWAAEMARSGEVVGVAVVVSYADGGSGHRYGGNIKTIGTIGTLTKLATQLSSE